MSESDLIPATPMQDIDGKPITVIEYHKTKSGWKPFSVIAGSTCYDFEFCQQDGVLAEHCSGFGGDIGKIHELAKFCDAPKLCAKIWYDHAQCKITYDGQPVSDKDARALGYQVIAVPLAGNPFDDPAVVEDDVEYCVQCGDYHPSESMCGHVLYEEGCGWSLGCGASEVDFSETQASLYRLLRMLSKKEIRRIRDRVSGSKSPIGWARGFLETFGNELRYEERYWPGIAWLASLDGPCRDARALTVGWLWMFERASWRACCILPEHQFIRHLSMPELKKWLAIDPLDPTVLHDKPLRVRLGFKARCANDIVFLASPEKCFEVTLWPPQKSGKCGLLGLTLSVAEVKRIGRNTVDIYFGAVIERNGQHVSEFDGYESRIS